MSNETLNHTESAKLFTRAQAVTPGGVNSPVRAFRGVGGTPIFMERAQGAHVFDADGNRYLDFVGSWGPLILGHAAPEVVEAVTAAVQNGTTFGATTRREVELAELVHTLTHVDQVRFVNSGTEATMSAVRLARGFTNRVKVVKFAGCYHGHADTFLADAGSGLATLGIPASAGVPPATVADTLTLPYNDLAAAEALMDRVGHEVAAIILEPIACNNGMILPVDGFLAGLRKLCDTHGALLIFDEVITGFRVHPGGAQALYGVRPDLSTYGKIIGGGLPVGAYGGRRDVMACVSPLGSVYQAGTLSGNPLAMAAGIAALKAIQTPGLYDQLNERASALVQGFNAVFAAHGHPARCDHIGSIFYTWTKPHAAHAPRNADDIKAGSVPYYAQMFHGLLQQGVYTAPSAFEVGFISRAHKVADVQQAVAALESFCQGSA